MPWIIFSVWCPDSLLPEIRRDGRISFVFLMPTHYPKFLDLRQVGPNGPPAQWLKPGGVSPNTVQRLRRANEIKPHLTHLQDFQRQEIWNRAARAHGIRLYLEIACNEAEAFTTSAGFQPRAGGPSQIRGFQSRHASTVTRAGSWRVSRPGPEMQYQKFA